MAGQYVPAGVYWEVERGLAVRLASDGPLPDLQTQQPSGYRRVNEGKYFIGKK